ncbi:MAG: hypothetical protein JGK30_08975 [Microcoleus sp. PH2017_40_RAT_O_B]|uniref:hypothetical protein n=1 Tax=unclassified Microcoleus TaxID=2642155 RepID=UPI001D541B85|nr:MULTISPECIES: hypothetical protein [unclassified Microcoleus]MCC3498624.1 hypothetical protein [Microcoleus sp. PH2017_15_JOR_U_A]MCC3570949.1 hypothetical protein [Microcoleus sp. PH2017_34_RAT_O_A]MCC3583932.1 hypothetical protein [Microcoleus sp. PH2017_30_WIL_O_A]MCC3609635.1 hypothetical protein [Microcoleus sp. PH2017_40_RAT_O_B]
MIYSFGVEPPTPKRAIAVKHCTAQCTTAISYLLRVNSPAKIALLKTHGQNFGSPQKNSQALQCLKSFN